jgi:hypothetical protein
MVLLVITSRHDGAGPLLLVLRLKYHAAARHERSIRGIEKSAASTLTIRTENRVADC